MMTHPWPAIPDGSLVETIVTTLGADGRLNVAPMGPIVDPSFERLLFRPFQGSCTFDNLCRSRQGVMHITDDVELFVRAALNLLDVEPTTTPAAAIEGRILRNACRWYAFRIDSIDASSERSEMLARVVDRGRFRDFLGFQRAKHAVIEAAIVATRLEILPHERVLADLERCAVIVDKTAGESERRALALVRAEVQKKIGLTLSP